MLAVIKACGNNMASIQFALQRLRLDFVMTDDPKKIAAASQVILPGVGHAQTAMTKLNEAGLVDFIKTLTLPVLGICLGMQLLYEYSAEGNTSCLSIIPGEIQKLQTNRNQPLPHMGWNDLMFLQQQDALSQKLPQEKYSYFVHSYAAPVNQYSVATTTYTQKFTSIVRYRNFYGMQFHPEKSAAIGEQLLLNFMETN